MAPRWPGATAELAVISTTPAAIAAPELRDFLGTGQQSQIPPPFMPVSKSAHYLIGDLHIGLGHHLMLHDHVLWRMLPARYVRRHQLRAPPP